MNFKTFGGHTIRLKKLDSWYLVYVLHGKRVKMSSYVMFYMITFLQKNCEAK